MSSAPLDPPEFLVDRSLGSVTVPTALAQLGFTIHTLESVWGERAATLPDEEWLERGGREGWLCLMKDKVRRRPENRSAIEAHGTKGFCITTGKLTGPEQAQMFVHNINRIIQAGRKPGPFLYAVYPKTIQRLFPRPDDPPSRRQTKLKSRR